MQYDGVPTPGKQVIPNGRNLFKIIVLFALILGAFIAGHYGAVAIENNLKYSDLIIFISKWSWLLLCGTVASVALQGLGILAHDGVHKVLFSKLWLNEIISALISAFSLLPFSANRQFHLQHHRFSHQKNLDPEEPMHNHALWFSITAGSLIGLLIQYQILFFNLFSRFFQKRYFLPVLIDLLFLSLAFSSYFIFLPLNGIPLEHSLLPMLLTLPIVFSVRAISDHYGLAAITPKEQRTEKQNEVSGWVILTTPILEWLWSNVNYHEVHHKFPYLSHTYLKSTFASTREQFPYVIANGYLRNLWRHLHRDYYNAKQPKSDPIA